MDPHQALKNIKTLAEVAAETDDIELMRKHFEMIVGVVDKVLKAKPRSPALGNDDLRRDLRACRSKECQIICR